MHRGAEAVEAETPGLACHSQRAMANQAGVHQRRRFAIVESRRHDEAEPLVRHGVFGITAVDLIAGETRPVAQILAAAAAEFANAARPAEPRHADAVADPQPLGAGAEGLDLADDLVAGHQRQLGFGQLAVDDVRSVRQTPQARARISAWPGPGSGGVRSMARSGARARSRIIASMAHQYATEGAHRTERRRRDKERPSFDRGALL